MSMDKKHLGAANELKAVLWLLRQGYEVFRNVSQSGAIDLIAHRGVEVLLVDVKSESHGIMRATQEQIDRGVKFLIVSKGDCQIIDPAPPLTHKECIRCGDLFFPR